jgi:hypothetical protein
MDIETSAKRGGRNKGATLGNVSGTHEAAAMLSTSLRVAPVIGFSETVVQGGSCVLPRQT